MKNSRCSPHVRPIFLAIALFLVLAAVTQAAELAFARSGPPGAPAKLIFQPTDEPATRLEAWEVIEEFQVRSVNIYDQHIGFTDLLHGNMNYQYSVPVSSAPRRFFRQQKITTSWEADFFYYTAHKRQGSMNLTIRRNELNHTVVTSGSLQEVFTRRWMDVQGYNMYGPFGPEYTQTDRVNATALPLMHYSGPVFAGTTVTNMGKPDSTDQTTTFDRHIISFYPLDAQAAANYWGAESFSSQRPPGGVFAVPPSPWTETSAQWTASGVGAPGAINSASFNYSLELSDEDTKAHVLARFEQSKALGNLESLPWKTERWVQYGGAEVSDDEYWSSSWLFLYNESESFESDGFIYYQKAQIRFVVPEALRIPGTVYRARIIETFYPNSPPYDTQTVSIFEAEMREGQWESPIFTPIARDNGSTEVQYFSVRADLIQPRKIVALGGSTAGAAPMEYVTSRPTLQAQFLLPNVGGQNYAERQVLIGSTTLQQIDLADAWGSIWDFDSASAKWSVLPGATATVRLWHWKDDGSPLGKWTLLAPDAELRDYFGSSSDFVFAEAVTGGQATVRITIDIRGKQVHDDLVMQAESVSALLAVDANRDGTINFTPDTSDATAADRPYRFWVNDDEDVSYASASWWSDLDPERFPARRADSINHMVDSPRDCEDLTRIWINAASLIDRVKDPSSDLYLGLKWKNTHGTHPGIRLFRSADPNGGLGHIKDATIGTQQAGGPPGLITSMRTCLGDADAESDSAPAIVIPWRGINQVEPRVRAADFIFRKDSLAEVFGNRSTGYLLFEGVQEGKGELMVVVVKKKSDGSWERLAEGASVWLQLDNIRRMYVRVHSEPMASNFPLPWQSSVATSPPPFPYTELEDHALTIPDERLTYGAGDTEENPSLFPFVPTAGEQNKCVVFVHGIDMTVPAQQGYAQSFYKRLWWEGYRGRFVAFRWSTVLSNDGFFGEMGPWGPGEENTSIFNSGEYRSWKSAASLRKYVDALRGELGSGAVIGVAGHSLGNVAVSEALRRGMRPNSYIAMEAAVSVSSYYWSNPAPGEPLPPPNLRLVNAESGNPTPLETDAGGYYGYLASLQSIAGVNRVNYYNADDFWLATGTTTPGTGSSEVHWVKNHEAFKPDDRFGLGKYTYDPAVNWAQFHRGATFTRSVLDPHEKMSFISRSRSSALGASAPPPGFSGLDLAANYGFERPRPDHSGQFQRNIQLMYGDETGAPWTDQSGSLMPFYRRLMTDLLVSP